VKRRLGVPDDLAACHTAEVAGYIIEGHVPAAASLGRNDAELLGGGRDPRTLLLNRGVEFSRAAEVR